MDYEEVPAVSGRRQAFGTGMLSGQQDGFSSPSFAEQAARLNGQTPKAYRPTGALNGISVEQYKTTLGGSFRTATSAGSAEDTWDTKRYLER